MNRKKTPKVCQFCNTAFEASISRAITCSRKCSGALQRKKLIKTKSALDCKECGAPFLSSRSDSKFCSYGCRNKFHARVTPKKVTSLKVCKCCGGKFKSNRTYCSKECFRLKNPDPEYQAINNVLSLRWDLLARVLPPEFKKLMYKIERRLPL